MERAKAAWRVRDLRHSTPELPSPVLREPGTRDRGPHLAHRIHFYPCFLPLSILRKQLWGVISQPEKC